MVTVSGWGVDLNHRYERYLAPSWIFFLPRMNCHLSIPGRPGRIEDEGTIQPRDNRDPAICSRRFFSSVEIPKLDRRWLNQPISKKICNRQIGIHLPPSLGDNRGKK